MQRDGASGRIQSLVGDLSCSFMLLSVGYACSHKALVIVTIPVSRGCGEIACAGNVS